MIQLNAIHLHAGSRFLLEDASLTVHAGQKVGLIGANGTGKSSLFRLLLGELQEDSGSVQVPKEWLLAHMAQGITDPRNSRSRTRTPRNGQEELLAGFGNLVHWQAHGVIA